MEVTPGKPLFDQRSKKFNNFVSHFQGIDDPPVDPYIRAGFKPDLVKAKRSLWKRLTAVFE